MNADAACTDINRLQQTVTDMDCLSQEGFSQIAAIATLALAALAGIQNMETFAHALLAIRGKAQDIENMINCEAEEVGCHYRDERARSTAN